MIILGLTGSIGMGKSTASAMFGRLGVPVYDADAAVHRVFAKDGAAVPKIAEAFPSAVREGAVDRAELSRLAVADPGVFVKLEAIVHPIVRALQRRLILVHSLRRTPLLVLDIPLLFETGGEQRCDVVAVVSAPAYLQARRVLARDGMTEEKFHAILARQTPDREKRRRADLVIPSNRGMAAEFSQIRQIVAALSAGWEPPNRPLRQRRQPGGFDNPRAL